MSNSTNPLCILPIEALVHIRSYLDGADESAFPITCQDLRTGDLAYRSIQAQQVCNLVQTVDSPLSRSLRPLAAMTLNTSEDLCAFNKEVAKVVGFIGGTVQKGHVVQAKEIVSIQEIQDRTLVKIWPKICKALLTTNPSIHLDPTTMTAQDIRNWMHENRLKLDKIDSLNLDGMGLSCLPKEIALLTNLRILTLSNNLLTTLPDSFGQLVNLEDLPLSDNRLIRLPDSFGQLLHLRSLNLLGNRLTRLPNSFGQLSSLERLALSDNQLTTLPGSFGRLDHLRNLNLGNNRLTMFPSAITELVHLEQLYLWDNQLTMLPDSFGGLVNLLRLNLRGNQLTALPDSFCRLVNLRMLSLEGNQLTRLPAEIIKLVAVERLDLSNNPLEELPQKNWLEKIEERNAGQQRMALACF